MSKKIWESGAVSIIVLPSGDQGRAILDLAQDWSRSWLLTPALWMLADEIPDFDPEIEIDLQVPPKLSAYLLGRDLEQNSVKEEVDVFWTLGSQPFTKVRFIAVRTEQNAELMRKTSIAAETAAKFISRSIPQRFDQTPDELLGSYFSKYNLIIAPTNDRGVLEGVLSQYWDANLIAAAEDRATPLSTDSFVKVGERFIGFALAHIATTAGLWAGLPVSSAEIKSEKTQHRQARLQRVFVRGVTSDTLSADVAHWALQKLNHSDTNFEIGAVEGHGVKTIASEYQDLYMRELVDYILKGPIEGDAKDNFLFKPFEGTLQFREQSARFKKFLMRIQDMASGLFGIPKWIRASAAYRVDFMLDEEYNDDILYDGIPKRLAPKVKLTPVDVLLASLKPKLPMPTPDLWKFMRKTISSAIDAPTNDHPSVLKDKNDELLVFATIDQVLPNPGAQWVGGQYSTGTEVHFEPVGWLDAPKAQEITANIQKRLDELEPGIADARSQLSETQLLVNQAKNELTDVNVDLDLIQRELEADQRGAKSSKDSHTHKLPRAVTDKAKRKSEGGGYTKNKNKSSQGSELEDFLNKDGKSGKKSKGKFWNRIFRRKGRAKS
jgi:hypothetical protein